MTPDRQTHLLVLVDALEARLGRPGQDADGWLGTVDLLARVAAYPDEERRVVGPRVVHLLSSRREACARLAQALPPQVSFESLVRRGEALADGHAGADDDAVDWALDLLRLAGAAPSLPPSVRPEALRVLRSGRSIVEISPEAFHALPQIAVQRVELESPRAQPLVWELLEAFGEVFVRAAEQAEEPTSGRLHPRLREVLREGHTLLGIPAAGWRSAVDAASAAIENYQRRQAEDSATAAFRAARRYVVSLERPLLEIAGAAHGDEAGEPVDPDRWQVAYEDASFGIDVAEVPAGDGKSVLVVAVRALGPEDVDLTEPSAITIAGPGGPPALRVRYRARRLWEAQLGPGGPWTIHVRGLAEPVEIALSGAGA